MISIPEEVITPKSLGGLPVQKVKDIPPNSNIFVYGDSGVGKTTLLGSADEVPEMRKVLILSFEDGERSIKDKYPNVERVKITRWDQVNEVYAEAASGKHDYNTFGIDSVTEAQDLNMMHLFGNDTKRIVEEGPSWEEYRMSLASMRLFIRAFKNLPYNMIFTCLTKEVTDQKRKTTNVRLFLTGQLAGQVPAFFDLVAYMYMKEVDGEQTRLMLTRKTEEHIAKDRSGKLPQVITNPTMKTLYPALVGK